MARVPFKDLSPRISLRDVIAGLTPEIRVQEWKTVALRSRVSDRRQFYRICNLCGSRRGPLADANSHHLYPSSADGHCFGCRLLLCTRDTSIPVLRRGCLP